MERDGNPPVRVLYVAPGDGGGADVAARALGDHPDVDVAAVETPAAAVRALDGEVDCVVCRDAPGVDCVAFLRDVREAAPRTPFVLAAGDGDERLASRAVAAGVSEYVPLCGDGSADRLLERVFAAVEDRRASDSSAAIDGLRLEEELRLKERAMDEAPVGIVVSDPDRPDNPLVYANDAFAELTGYPKEDVVGRNCRFLQGPRSDPDAVGAMREAIDAGEPVSVELLNYRADGDPFWNRVDVAPVRDADGDVTNYVGFQTDVTARKAVELDLEAERRDLERLVHRINGLVQDVTRRLVESETRAEVEREVCARVAAEDAYTFACVAETDADGGAVTVRSRSGSAPESDDSADGPGRETVADDRLDVPVVSEAARTREPGVVTDPEELRSLTRALPGVDGDEVAGAAALPLTYQNTLYGVLTVLATDADAVGDRELVVLEAIARMTATAVNALERGRMLVADRVVELEFEVRDPDLFFVGVSADLSCRFEYEGSVSRSDGSALMFFTTGADPDAVVDAATRYPGVTDVSVVHEDEGTALLEVAVADGSVVAALSERGGRTTDVGATDGRGVVTVELPTETDARAVVEQFADRYDRTELLAYREIDRPPETRQEFVADVEQRLTDRQLTALQTAYVGGFYDRRRRTSGDELAASMDISRVTFHQHRRAAERKLLAAFFDRGGSE
ncbi:MAG: bacterio-opsin activator domain-containing protein [Halobacteriaceae archaeon]